MREKKIAEPLGAPNRPKSGLWVTMALGDETGKAK